MRTCLICLVALISMVGCQSPYTLHYRSNAEYVNPKDAALYVQPNGPVDLRIGGDPIRDRETMMEDGYALVGYSSFQDGRMVNTNDVFTQAANIGATIVMTYTPRHIASAYGSTSVAVPAGRGAIGVGIPIEFQTLDYLAVFWIKQKAFGFGAYFAELTQDERAELGSNRGAKIALVIKGTPAFRADVLKGDIILKVDGIDVDDVAHLRSLLTSRMGQEVTLDVVRAKGTRATLHVALAKIA